MTILTAHPAPAPLRCEAAALRLGTSLKRRRVSLGLSQAEVAERTAMSRSEYEHVERGDWPAGTSLESLAHTIAFVALALGDDRASARLAA